MTPDRQVAREMPHHLKRFAVARQAVVKHSRMVEVGDGARNIICVKPNHKRKPGDLERVLQPCKNTVLKK